jgi:hypothetical protein
MGGTIGTSAGCVGKSLMASLMGSLLLVAEKGMPAGGAGIPCTQALVLVAAAIGALGLLARVLAGVLARLLRIVLALLLLALLLLTLLLIALLLRRVLVLVVHVFLRVRTQRPELAAAEKKTPPEKPGLPSFKALKTRKKALP